ncbi:MAG: hypothetical protein DHS20C13_04560 [Thermodesulfobacteriota bacterium]|nr:MAG: hypothetical protein DHS20C13_04560 [Thermodesulfobacteriota bacterium]
MKASRTKSDTRQKIIDKALELFYRQGYLATGINQVIAESGVAKNTFYYYFPSKNDLCVSYLQEIDRNWINSIKTTINSSKKPLDRLFAPLEFLKKWNEDNAYRGCPFLNIVSEITDSSSNIRKETIYHKDGFKTIIRELVKDLKESNKKYFDTDVESVTDAYYLLAEGAIVTSQNYKDNLSFKVARNNIEKLLNPS